MLPSCPHFPFISPLSIPTFSLLLPHPQADVNQGDSDGQTPLYIAAENNHAAIVDLLETAGAKKWSYLTAAKDGNVEAIQELIAGGQADVNQGNKRGQTPLLFAVEKGSTEIAALLIEAKVRSVCGGGEVKATTQPHVYEGEEGTNPNGGLA